MSQAEQEVQRMLAEGIITAEEANSLLTALGPQITEVSQSAADTQIKPENPLVESSPYLTDNRLPEQLNPFRHIWQIPFFIAVATLLVTGIGLALMYQTGDQVVYIG